VGRRSTRVVDIGLGLVLVAIALQLVPLTAGVRDRVSPAAAAYDRAMRLDAAVDLGGPLSIDPAATVLALIFVAAIVLLFWCARTMFRLGGIRTTIHAVAWIGLFVSPLAIVHHVIPLPGIDLAWGLTARGLRPYGPFVNRNDFAGWLIMAIPLTLGYAFARIHSRHRAGEALDAEVAFDSKSIWLGVTICLMLAGLLSSLSRSGLLGAVVGFLFFAWRSRRQMTVQRAKRAALLIGVILAVAATYADMGALTTRLEGSFSEGLASRISIWRQTWPVVRNFWPFGSGAGTYQSVMVLYQTMSRFYYVAHADNEVLQILAEGGLLLGIPVAITIVAGARLIMKRLREDRTAAFWLRVGAIAGMVAIATQNMVEMTLRVPANAVLFAILAAVAVHHRAVRDNPSRPPATYPG
jgi:O-antigen ligase